MSLEFAQDTVRGIRFEIQKTKRDCEKVADNLEEIDHVPESSVAHYRGRAEMCGDIVEALDQLRRELNEA